MIYKKAKTLEEQKAMSNLRHQRFERLTKYKVCSVRALSSFHKAIKEFAKLGKCAYCDNKDIKHERIINRWSDKFERFKNKPCWEDEFTKRDGYVAAYCFSIFIFYLLGNKLFIYLINQ